MSFKKILTQDYAFQSPPDDPRILTRLVANLSEADFVLQGYPDDDGIRLNGGRTGAHLGPHEVRKCFYKMTVGDLPAFSLFDEGNISTEIPLSERHQLAQQRTEEFYGLDKMMLSIGGGHDYGYPDAQAFLNHFKSSKKKPIVINFDAHLDVRPLDKGLTSGTPFFRLLTNNPGSFHFFEVGIQPHCNSASHRTWCEEHGGRILPLHEIEKSGLASALKKNLTRLKGHPTFLSVDIDAFSSAFAPGCSQSWPTGLMPSEFFKAFDFLFQHLNVKGLGIYEVSPPLDLQPLTSRLAALILYRCLKNSKRRDSHAEVKPPAQNRPNRPDNPDKKRLRKR